MNRIENRIEIDGNVLVAVPSDYDERACNARGGLTPCYFLGIENPCPAWEFRLACVAGYRTDKTSIVWIKEQS